MKPYIKKFKSLEHLDKHLKLIENTLESKPHITLISAGNIEMDGMIGIEVRRSFTDHNDVTSQLIDILLLRAE